VNVKDAANAVRAAAGLVAEVLPVTADDVLEACSLLGSSQASELATPKLQRTLSRSA
jgi:hypothetical protein